MKTLDKKNKEEELFIPKTKYKALKIILAILLIGGLCVGGYFLYQDKFNNPKNIVKNALEISKKELSESIFTKEIDDKYKINGFVKVDSSLNKENNKVGKIINDISFQFSGEIDPSESIANIEINTKYKDDKLIDLETYLENSTSYILLEGIYDKYIKYEINKEENDDLKDNFKKLRLKSSNIKKLINILVDSFKEEIIKYDFNQENAVITIDGEVTSLLNNYVILKNKEVNTLRNNIIKSLLNNKEMISVINNLIDDGNGKEILETLQKEINNSEFNGTYRINFYTDKNIFNKKIISIRQEIIQNNITTSYNIDKIENGLIISTDLLGLNYSIKIKKNSSNFNLSIALKSLEETAGIEVNVNYEKIKELTKPDISKNINIDKLTKDDKKIIEEGFNKIDALKELYNKIKDSIPELKD